MAQNESEIRYLTPPTVEIKKKKYCRFKKNRIRYIDYKDPEFLKKFRIFIIDITDPVFLKPAVFLFLDLNSWWSQISDFRFVLCHILFLLRFTCFFLFSLLLCIFDRKFFLSLI